MTDTLPARAARPKYEGIEVLRFVAALLVVILHATFYARERLDPSVENWGFGAVGVHIFFTISGFVMAVSTGSLIGTRDGWKYFAMRRIVRIVPMYWIATTLKLATMFVLPAAVLHSAFDPGKIALSYLFLPSRNMDGNVEPTLGVGWTLIFEMMFYFVFAVALLLRVNVFALTGTVLGLMAAGSLLREGTDWPAWAVYFDPIVLYFLIGMAIGKASQIPAAMRYAPYLASLLGLGYFAASLLIPGFEFVAKSNHPLIFMLVSCIVLTVVWLEPFIKGRVPGVFLYLGAASYSLYLFHPLVAPLAPEILKRVGLSNSAVSVGMSILGALVVSLVIYRFVEKPLTGFLQKRLPYLRKPVARVPTTVK